VDARRTPSGILSAHPADQISDLTPDLRSSPVGPVEPSKSK
jgi:hypothetical protein